MFFKGKYREDRLKKKGKKETEWLRSYSFSWKFACLGDAVFFSSLFILILIFNLFIKLRKRGIHGFHSLLFDLTLLSVSHVVLGVASHLLVSKVQLGIVSKATGQPEEGLLEIVVGLSRDVVVLEVLSAVEGNHLCLDLTVGGVDLVTHEDDGDVVADTGDVTEPVGHVAVGLARSNFEHDDGAVTLDVVTVTEATELFLAGGVPAVEADLAAGGLEGEGMDVDTDGGDVALFEVTGQVTLDEGGLAGTTVTDEDELEGGDDTFERVALRSRHDDLV